ncbi:MAG: RHS repeat-associated core domain-containing protein [Myxococcota bacterium]
MTFPSPIQPVRHHPPRPEHPPAPVFAVTSNATANAALASLDTTIAPFREAPPPEQGAAGYVAAAVGGALGVVNAPAMFIDSAVSAGASAAVSALENALGIGPLFPGMPVARMGITMHIGTPHTHGHPPSLNPPLPPIPLPSIGVAMLSGSASVLVNGIPALRAGDVGLGLTCGSMAPPFEIVTGAGSVYFAGARVARIGADMTMHCNPAKPIGAFAKVMGVAGAVAGAASTAAQITAGNPVAAAVQAAQTILDAAALAMSALRGKDPAGPPGVGVLVGPPSTVLAGGPPIPNVGAWAQGHLFSAIGKALKTLKNKAGRGSPSRDANGTCTKAGEPVNVVTGENYNTYQDFKSLYGAFMWTRHATSARAHERGRLGYCFRHVLEARLDVHLHRVTFFGYDGERVEFPRLKRNEREITLNGYKLVRLSDTLFQITERRLGQLEFRRDNALRNDARLTAIANETARANLIYSPNGLLTEIREAPLGSSATTAQYTLSYDGNGYLAEIHCIDFANAARQGLPRGIPFRLVAYGYDSEGRLIAAQDALGLQERYRYDGLHRIIEATDRRGYSFRWEYDLEGRCTLATGEDGIWLSRFEYAPDAQKTALINHDGTRRTTCYDEDGVATKIIDELGGVLERVRDEQGRIRYEVNAAGEKIGFRYDRDGAHTARVDRFGHVFPPQLELPQLPDPWVIGVPETHQLRTYGRLLRRVLGHSQREELLARVPIEAASTIREVLDSTSARATEPTREFDVYGRVVKATHADGTSEQWQYDGTGNEVMRLDREGRLYQQSIYSWNLIAERIDPLGNTFRYTHTPYEQTASIVDPLGTRSEYEYDEKDRLVRVRRHGRVREEYVKDIVGRTLERKGSAGQTLLKHTLHECGRNAKTELASGETYTFDYNQQGECTLASSTQHEVAQDWDTGRNLTRWSCDDREITHSYGGPDHARERTVVAGKYLIRFESSQPVGGGSLSKRARHVFAPNGFVWTIQQDDQGLIRIRHGAAVGAPEELQQYDAKGHLTGRLVHRRSTNPTRHESAGVWSTRYQYTPEGDLTEIRDSERGRRVFEIDAAHRLAAELRPDGSRVSYALDEAGNLVSKPGLLLVKFSSGNRLLHAGAETFIYNDRDHIAERSSTSKTVRYEHDSWDQLVAIHDNNPVAWTAEYDGLNRRVSAGRGDQQTLFWWDNNRLAAETAPDGRLRIYVYAHEKAFVPLGFVDYDSVDAPAKSGRAYTVFSDQVGMPLHIEDTAGNVVWFAEHIDPYGAVTVRADSTIEYNLRWPGHYYDPDTGLHYNRYRYYDPHLGRYLQSDPIGYSGGNNLYAYPSNPLVAVDVLGLSQGGCKNHNHDSANATGEGDPHPVPLDKEGHPTAFPSLEAKEGGGRGGGKTNETAQRACDTIRDLQTANGRKKIAKEIIDRQGTPEERATKAIAEAEAQAKANNEVPLSDGEKQQIATNAQRDYDRAVNAKAKELESKKMRDRSVTIIEHEDGTSTVGISGRDDGGRTRQGKNLTETMNERYGTDEYHSTSDPVRTGELTQDDSSNPKGQCSEPHAAQGAGEYAQGDPAKAPKSYQTAWSGDKPPTGHVRTGPDGNPQTLPDGKTQLMNPCLTCQKNAAEGDKYGGVMEPP